MSASPRERYLAAYAQLRAGEGRGAGGEAELLALPYLTTGPLARQWEVRARTYDRFVTRVLSPLTANRGRPLRLVDLGAGNGWLCYRARLLGHRAVACDVRCDTVDGLGAARPYARHLPRPLDAVAATFEALPFPARTFDVALFNASLHHAEDLGRVLHEAARVVASGGRVAILDSPFYRRAETGEAMVEEKKRNTVQRYAALADDLLALPSIEYLTARSLKEAAGSALTFRKHRVTYPAWYELRPLKALLTRSRPPSRFDLWVADVA
ncbi:MAG: class I SAM-dependent methyltransferase [Thermoanaerobaculia bacterium]